MRVLFSGGGTGGHLYPTLSLAHALLHEGADEGACRPPDFGQTPSGSTAVLADQRRGGVHAVLFVGAQDNVDEELLTRDDVPYKTVKSLPLAGVSRLGKTLGIAGNATGVVQALPILSHFKPDAVVASGGYACAPAVLAAAMLRASGRLPRMRIMLIEPNVTPGLANRRLATYADEVWGAYPDSKTAKYFKEKFRLTGIPVRAELRAPISKADARRSLGLDPDHFTLLVFGGSQGARSLNVATSGMVARRKLQSDWQILHLTGRRDFDWMLAERKAERNDNRYTILPYLDNMALGYWAADLAVCRAGASTLAELSVVGLPAIFVPYPKASEDHQQANAEYFSTRGAAFCLKDSSLSPDSLYWAIVEHATSDKLRSVANALRRLAQPKAVDIMLARLFNENGAKSIV